MSADAAWQPHHRRFGENWKKRSQSTVPGAKAVEKPQLSRHVNRKSRCSSCPPLMTSPPHAPESLRHASVWPELQAQDEESRVIFAALTAAQSEGARLRSLEAAPVPALSPLVESGPKAPSLSDLVDFVEASFDKDAAKRPAVVSPDAKEPQMAFEPPKSSRRWPWWGLVLLVGFLYFLDSFRRQPEPAQCPPPDHRQAILDAAPLSLDDFQREEELIRADSDAYRRLSLDNEKFPTQDPGLLDDTSEEPSQDDALPLAEGKQGELDDVEQDRGAAVSPPGHDHDADRLNEAGVPLDAQCGNEAAPPRPQDATAVVDASALSPGYEPLPRHPIMPPTSPRRSSLLPRHHANDMRLFPMLG